MAVVRPLWARFKQRAKRLQLIYSIYSVRWYDDVVHDTDADDGDTRRNAANLEPHTQTHTIHIAIESGRPFSRATTARKSGGCEVNALGRTGAVSEGTGNCDWVQCTHKCVCARWRLLSTKCSLWVYRSVGRPVGWFGWLVGVHDYDP